MTDRTHIGNAALQPIQSLQVFRGMAAVFVLLYHVHVISNTRYGIEFANGAFNMGNIGVDFFFVLSGFIIWFVHHKDMSQPERLPIYILKRFFRVWPLLAILTTFKLIYIFAGPGTGINQSKSSLETIVCSYFILPVPAGQPVLDVAWTLSHEMLFYIVITVGILFGKRILLLCFAVWMITIFICIFAPNGSLSYLTLSWAPNSGQGPAKISYGGGGAGKGLKVK